MLIVLLWRAWPSSALEWHTNQKPIPWIGTVSRRYIHHIWGLINIPFGPRIFLGVFQPMVIPCPSDLLINPHVRMADCHVWLGPHVGRSCMHDVTANEISQLVAADPQWLSNDVHQKLKFIPTYPSLRFIHALNQWRASIQRPSRRSHRWPLSPARRWSGCLT